MDSVPGLVLLGVVESAAGSVVVGIVVIVGLCGEFFVIAVADGFGKYVCAVCGSCVA